MRVPKIIWKHNLLIHSSSSRAGDPVQWSNFPQQQDALEKKFSTTWSTLFCCSLWKSPFYFLSNPIQILEQQFWSVHSKPFSLDETEFFCAKKKYRCRFCQPRPQGFSLKKEEKPWGRGCGFACSFGLQFHLFWCSVAFHRCPPPPPHRKMGGGGGGELLCHARNKGVKLEYDFLRSSLGWEWWPWLSEKCVFVANIWLNRGFLWGYLGKEGRRGKIGNLF